MIMTTSAFTDCMKNMGEGLSVPDWGWSHSLNQTKNVISGMDVECRFGSMTCAHRLAIRQEIAYRLRAFLINTVVL